MKISKKYYLATAIVVAVALFITGAILTDTFGLLATGDCTNYVDNHAAPGGDGSPDHPWTTIASHLNSLSPGNTLCVTGGITTTHIYNEDTIHFETDRITLRPLEPNHLVCIRNADATGYTIELNADYCILEGFEIDHARSFYYGIPIRGSHNILRNNEIHNVRNHNIVVEPNATHNEISGNHIHHIERTGDDAHGVMIQSRAHHTIVDGNTIHDCSGDGVQMHDYNWTSFDDSPAGCQITNNHFYRGTLPRTENAISSKNSNNLVIRGNTIHGYDHTTIMITKPQHAGTVLIEHNTIYDCRKGVCFTDDLRPDSVEFRQNLIYNISGQAIHVWSGRNINITHNTIVNAHTALWVGNYWARGELKNNLWYASGSPVLHSGASTASMHHNGWFDTHAAGVFADLTDTIHDGAPGFVNAAGHNYHLTADSPARGAGQGETDLGAFPYSEETPTPGWATCPPDPTCATSYPEQPTLTPRPTYTPASVPTCPPTKTCPPNPSPTHYPTATPYPTSTAYPPRSATLQRRYGYIAYERLVPVQNQALLEHIEMLETK